VLQRCEARVRTRCKRRFAARKLRHLSFTVLRQIRFGGLHLLQRRNHLLLELRVWGGSFDSELIEHALLSPRALAISEALQLAVLFKQCVRPRRRGCGVVYIG